MKYVYVLIDSDKNVIAIYEDKDVANKLKPHLETKLNIKIEIEKRILNPDINLIGIFK